MTSIRDIPFEQIEKFLAENSKTIPDNENAAYNLAFSLLKSKNTIGYTLDIVAWMIAHNLIKNKVIIPNYTAAEIDAMSQEELNKLARLLTIKDVTNIKKILGYMHKLDEGVDIRTNKELTVAGKEIYDIILSNLVGKDLSRMEINKYSRFALGDQKYWKARLLEKFGLRSNDPNFDYKFTVQFLSNGKSFEDNYHEAMEKGLKPIIKLLLDNKVVETIQPYELLFNIQTTLPELAEIKNLPYDQFLNEIIKQTNEIYEDEPDLKITRKDMDKIEFTDNKFVYEFEHDLSDDVTLKEIDTSNGGITNGEILYNFAKQISTEDDFRKQKINYIKNHPIEILREIEYNRISMNKHEISAPKNRFYPNKQLVIKKIYEQPTKYFLSNLIKDPEAFLDYANKNIDEFRFLPYFGGDYGDHIYFEGLTLRDYKFYYINLGS